MTGRVCLELELLRRHIGVLFSRPYLGFVIALFFVVFRCFRVALLCITVVSVDLAYWCMTTVLYLYTIDIIR